MRILVTGGAGFIGSHLIDRLIELNHEVDVIDDFSTGRIENLERHIKNGKLKVYKGSILDIELLTKVVKNQFEYIFHLAAAVGVFNIVKNPLSSLITNLRGTENILEIADKFRIPIFIASSSEVYGKNSSNSLKESDDRVLGPPSILRWSYSEAKALDESMAIAYWQQTQLKVRIARFFNTVGPRQVGEYGMVLPRFVHWAINNQPIKIYGSGMQTRCFIHIEDVIDAILHISFNESTVGQILNIGNPFEISILNLAHEVINQLKSKSTIKNLPYREVYGPNFEDMEKRVPNINLINSLTGWYPKRNIKKIISDVSNAAKNIEHLKN